MERKPVSWLKNHPRFKEKLNDIPDGYFMTNIDGDVYERIQNSQGKEGIIDFRQHWEKYKTIVKGEEVTRYKVTYLAGSIVLDTIDPVMPNRYPFAILYDYKQRKEFWGKSTCAMILDNQKLVNKVESIIALIGTQLQNPQRVVARNTGINPAEVAKYGGAPGKVWYTNGDPSKSIVNLEPPQIPVSLFNMAQQAAANIREISGMSEAYTGNIGGSIRSTGGIQMLIDRTMMRDNYMLRAVGNFCEELARIAIDFITHYHTETRNALINVQKGNVLTKEAIPMAYKGTDYKGITFDFFIDASEQAPVSKQRQQQEADKLINMQGQFQFNPAIITAEEYIQRSDFMDKDEIIARMKNDQLQSNEGIMSQVLQASLEALYSHGGNPQAVMEFAQQMLQQKMQEQQQGPTGNVNSSQFQQAQSAPQMGGPQNGDQ